MAPHRKVTADAVAKALRKLRAANGNQPTIAELRIEIGVGSTRTVLRYLKELEANGLIERWHGARGIRFKDESSTWNRMMKYEDMLCRIADAPARTFSFDDLRGMAAEALGIKPCSR